MDVFDALTPLATKRLRASVLVAFVQPYRDRLVGMGYSHGTVRSYVNCLSHFANWTARRRFELVALDHHVEHFVSQHLPRCRCAGPVQRTRHVMRSALEHLKTVVIESGVALQSQALGATDQQLQRFDQYLQQMKGLSTSTRRRRLLVVRPLVAMTSDAALPTADQLRQFLRQELPRVSAASASTTTTAVRSYLRFRAFEGDRIEHLLPIVASPANWRLAPLPQTLNPGEVQRLLDAFPPGLPSRLRCYAIVRCLVDLGLRSSEVIALVLDDVDWTAGTVRIGKAKSRRVDALPLPQTTGAAIAEYIRSERPPTSSRRIFVRHVAPVDVPIGADVVRRTVREAYRRAGLQHTRCAHPAPYACRQAAQRRRHAQGGRRCFAASRTGHLTHLCQGRLHPPRGGGDAVAGESGMSGGNTMKAAVQRYLDDRRCLGFELTAPGTELIRFARYADARNLRGPLTQQLILGWTREHVKRTTDVTAARRLEVLRPFAAYYRQFEPATEIPPAGILGRGHRRLVPHIYTDEEVVQLLQGNRPVKSS